MVSKHRLSSVLLIAFLVLIVSTSVVFAGVSAPYWSSRPLEMAPGETKDVELVLTNGEDTEDNVVVSLEEGSEIAEITSGTSYTVPPKSNTVKLALRVTIPSSANIGDKYDVRLKVQSTGGQEDAGTVQLGVGYNVKFPVVIISEVVEVSEVSAAEAAPRGRVAAVVSVIVIIIIIIIIILVWWLLRRNRQEA